MEILKGQADKTDETSPRASGEHYETSSPNIDQLHEIAASAKQAHTQALEAAEQAKQTYLKAREAIDVENAKGRTNEAGPESPKLITSWADKFQGYPYDCSSVTAIYSDGTRIIEDYDSDSKSLRSETVHTPDGIKVETFEDFNRNQFTDITHPDGNKTRIEPLEPLRRAQWDPNNFYRESDDLYYGDLTDEEQDEDYEPPTPVPKWRKPKLPEAA